MPTPASILASDRCRKLTIFAFGVALGLLASLGIASSGRAAPYKLQAGDTLRVVVAEIPSLDVQSTIDIDGNVQVPRLGSFPAAGRTVAELQTAIGVAAAGRTIAFFTPAGERREATLVGTEVFVELVGYRPVYVTGDVARPGQVDFEPGMTARSAIASAGGLSTVPVLFDDALQRAPELQAEYQRAALGHAAAVVRLWGIDATLRRDGDRATDLPAPVRIDDEAFERLLAVERRRVHIALSEARIDRKALGERFAYLTDRVARLEETLANTEEALALEEEDAARISALNERGLAPTARLSDARQSLLLVSSRLLSVQDSLARFTLERDDARQQLDNFDQRFEKPLIAERAEVISRIFTYESTLASARRALEINGQTVEAFGARLTPEVRIEIVRGNAESRLVNVADLDTRLLPGDVVEVDVVYDYQSLELRLPEAEDAPVDLPDAP